MTTKYFDESGNLFTPDAEQQELIDLINKELMTTLYPQPPPEIVTVTFELIHPNAKAPTRATKETL